MSRVAREWGLAGVVVVIGAVLRFVALGAESVTNDEMYSIHFVQRYTPTELLARYPTLDPHPPLYYLLLDAWSSLVGVSEFLVRVPSAAFGVGTVGATYALGRRTFDHRVGAIAALCVAVSTLHVYHAQEARMYSLFTLFVASSFYYYVGAIESETRRQWTGYVATTALLLYTHVFGAFVVLAQVLYIAFRERRAIATRDQKRIAPWAAAYLAVGLAYLPPLALLVRQVVLIRETGVFVSWIQPPSILAVPRTFLTYVGYQPETPVLLVRAVPFVVLASVAIAAWGFVAFGRYRPNGGGVISDGPEADPGSETERANPPDDWTGLLVIWVAVGHAAPWLLSHLVTPIYVSRYTIGASLGVFLLVAAGIRRGLQSFETDAKTDRRVTLALVSLLVVSLMVPLGGYYGEHQRDQWRDAVEYVDEQADDDDAVLVLSDSPDLADLSIVYRYYADRSRATVVPIGSKNETHYDRVATIAPSFDRIWLVTGLSHSVTEAERNRFGAVLNRTCSRGETRRFTGVAIEAFEC